jgi:type I restriction enzyme S subunit
MESEWPRVAFADAPVVIIDGDRGKNYPKRTDFLESGHCLFLNTGNVTTDGFDFSQCQFITKQKDTVLRKGKIKRHDLVMTTRGTVGNVAYYNDRIPFDHIRINSGMVIFRPDPQQVEPLYLYQFLRSSVFKRQVAALRTGSAQPQLPIRDINRIKLSVPPLAEQQAIAHILGTLDDKIELNRRMNETLEAMAQAIFKSWFVDFDPVRARLDGQQPPGLAPHIAELLPDAFEASELGEIPEGWGIEPIGDIIDAVGGGTPSTKNPAYWEDGIHYFATPKSLSGLSSPILLETERKVTDAGLAKISSGLLPVGTVLLSSRAPVGYLAITEIPVCINQGFIAMICDGKVSNYYVLNWAHANMAEIKLRAGGTTFAEISKRNFRPIPALVPPAEVIAAFDAVTEPLYTKIRVNLEESRTLAELRDALLPKLISGELRVPDAERIVGRCL